MRGRLIFIRPRVIPTGGSMPGTRRRVKIMLRRAKIMRLRMMAARGRVKGMRPRVN
ncbi:hypothetical protein [Hymenobacter gummosus]|uniref:hypothetical protein n=1 Tax=Hymenobacter gummosus TaxID=1776032 RepID=UPI0014043B11|nr:hypothetical protein [Hymenobacter gummosus]